MTSMWALAAWKACQGTGPKGLGQCAWCSPCIALDDASLAITNFDIIVGYKSCISTWRRSCNSILPLLYDWCTLCNSCTSSDHLEYHAKDTLSSCETNYQNFDIQTCMHINSVKHDKVCQQCDHTHFWQGMYWYDYIGIMIIGEVSSQKVWWCSRLLVSFGRHQ